ncbi:MAG TPA: two-component regulator propeller domain-containing protein, partial [Candidatus Limnocylindria bacterium]|nr:two-component regulator propeller domain-containing protein [Candidatus Limnocylindria bacterium]
AEGLIRLHQRSAALWGVSQGLPGDMCWSVSSGPDGRLWVGTQAGIGVISGTGMAQAVKGPLATNAVHLVLATRENRVWCVIGDRRVYWSDAPETGGPWHPFPLGDRRVKVLYEDRDGVLWAGTDIGVVKIAGKMPSEIPFEGREHLIPFEVSAIHQDRSGVLWFGTQAGAVLRNVGNDWQRYPASGAILDMHEEGDGGMWFGTTHGVAYCLDQRWREFGPEQGIADQMYLGLYEDAAKHFWLAGPRGLQRVGLPELKAVAAGNTARVFPLNLVELDGVAEYDYAGQRQPGGTLDRLGQLWLPTAQGLLQVDPRRLLENTAPPAAVIIGASFEDLKVDEGAVRRFCTPAAVDETAAAEPEHLRIAGSRGHFVQLRFTANTFLATHQVQFRYRLSPFDQEWQRVAGSRVAIYTNLPAGDYAFEVQAANSQSVWNRRGQIFHFALVPPFYETRWFIVVCALGLLVVILVLARRHYRNNEQRLRGDRLALEQERSRIARDLHDDLGANLTGLAMQAEIAGKLLTGPGAEELQRFAVTTRSLAQRLREVIWAVDPESDTLESLTAFLGQQTDQLLGPTPLRYRFEAPPHLPALRLRAGTRHQLAMSAREAMNNILKYAHANEVKVRIELAEDNLSITIRDDGVGLPSGAVTSSGRSVVGGNGLKNIRQRLKSLGGNFRVSNAPGGGTLVRLDVPLAAVTAVESTTENPPNEHQSSDR